MAIIFNKQNKVNFDNTKKSAGILEDYTVRKSIHSRAIVVGDHDDDLEKPQVVNVTMDTEGTPPASAPDGTVHLTYTA